ncbi:MAG: type II toxin-antitoxin system VapC family toxin [bacterium]|nr:type II toxin-antitoxin system VapC family toxin [bacterium]
MAKIFLDTNIFVDLVEKRKNIEIADFFEHELFLSPLSVHILTYIYKYSMPDKKLEDLKKHFNVVSLNMRITEQSIIGPTSDFEDNVQLHSAAQAECDLFWTEDKKLLALKFFGKTRMASSFK